jgi:hypothetical protein
MKGTSHKETTGLAIVLLHEVDPYFPLQDAIEPQFPVLSMKLSLGDAAMATDFMQDTELVLVKGTPVGDARDDPHSDQTFAVDDHPHYKEGEYCFTAFNHFIDIRKGKGSFDDFDGYSYDRGSASQDQHEDATEAASDANYLAGLLVEIINYLPGSISLDEGLMWYYNDEYVHAPGQDWYRGCSSSVERYSYFRDQGTYSSVEEEAVKRFPRAQATGLSGEGGVPRSVFMPVDNLARYWFNLYKSERKPSYLGPVMHAVQDACIPHHAAGCIGNWHGKYEEVLDNKLCGGWATDSNFKKDVKSLFLSWMQENQNPPKSLTTNDWGLHPNISWSIDMLVTWMALNAYRQYVSTYGNFRNGYQENDSEMMDLTKKAVAMSMLCICKAVDYNFKKASVKCPIDEPAFWLLF